MWLIGEASDISCFWVLFCNSNVCFSLINIRDTRALEWGFSFFRIYQDSLCVTFKISCTWTDHCTFPGTGCWENFCVMFRLLNATADMTIRLKSWLACGVLVRLTTWVLVWSIATVFFAVAEQTAFDAVSVTARQESILTERFVGDEQRLDFSFLIFRLAVLDSIFPVTRLLLDVKV